MELNKLNHIEAFIVCLAFTIGGIGIGRSIGHAEGLQECPMAVVPKCDLVFRGDKLIKTICPDSTRRFK